MGSYLIHFPSWVLCHLWFGWRFVHALGDALERYSLGYIDNLHHDHPILRFIRPSGKLSNWKLESEEARRVRGDRSNEDVSLDYPHARNHNLHILDGCGFSFDLICLNSNFLLDSFFLFWQIQLHNNAWLNWFHLWESVWDEKTWCQWIQKTQNYQSASIWERSLNHLAMLYPLVLTLAKSDWRTRWRNALGDRLVLYLWICHFCCLSYVHGGHSTFRWSQSLQNNFHPLLTDLS